METLRFTSRDILEIENIQKKPLIEVIKDQSMENVALFIKKGLKLNDQGQALDRIDRWIEEGEIMESIHYEIYETLVDAHFLSVVPEMTKAKVIIQEAKSLVNSAPQSGNKTKNSL